MTSFEDFRSDLTSRLDRYFKSMTSDHERECRSLREENATLRGQLRRGKCNSPANTKLPALPVVVQPRPRTPPVSPHCQPQQNGHWPEAYTSEQHTEHERKHSASELLLLTCAAHCAKDTDLDKRPSSEDAWPDEELEINHITDHWGRIVGQCLEHHERSKRFERFSFTLELRPIWAHTADDKVKVDVAQSKRVTQLVQNGSRLITDPELLKNQATTTTLDSISSFVNNSCIRLLMRHPESQFNSIRDVICVSFIVFDLIMFPLLVFDMGESAFSLTSGCVTALFWTVEMVLSFFQGFHTNGAIEMRPAVVMFRYLKSWFLLDLVLVTVDWTILWSRMSGSNVGSAGGLLRMGRLGRALRILRLLRLMRTIKCVQYCSNIMHSIESDSILLLTKLFCVLLIILVATHYAACIWYGTGTYNEASPTWLKRHNLVHEESVYTLYITSFHFSVTQFAGSQDIVPTNALERGIATFLIVFDLVIFSSLVSTVTTYMAQFQASQLEKSQEEARIRAFLNTSGVPRSFTQRLWHYFRSHYRRKEKRLNAEDIYFFGQIPSKMLRELHEHIYVPVLKAHPLLRHLNKKEHLTLMIVCKTALQASHCQQALDVFSSGDHAPNMLFVMRGQLFYECPYYDDSVDVVTGMWISEAALWSKWLHCGNLITASKCQILRMNCHAFETVMVDRVMHTAVFRGLRKYAASFAQRMSDSLESDDPITDLDLVTETHDSSEMLESLVTAAFPKDDKLTELPSEASRFSRALSGSPTGERGSIMLAADHFLRTGLARTPSQG